MFEAIPAAEIQFCTLQACELETVPVRGTEATLDTFARHRPSFVYNDAALEGTPSARRKYRRSFAARTPPTTTATT